MTCGAETSQFELRYIEEVTPGTTPPTGDMQILRNTGVAGGVAKSTTQSEEIRSDRQITDLIMTKKEPSKDVSGEFSFATWDDMLEAGLFTDWSNIHYASDDVEVLAGNVYQLPAGHGLTFLPGQIINVAGFTTAANNGVKIVSSFSVNDITVTQTLTIEAAGDDVTIDVLGYASNDVEVLAGNIYELPSGHGLTFIPGQAISWAGFTETANNGIKTVSAFSGDQITVSETLTIEAAGDSVTARYDVLSNGVDKKTFTFEDDFTDVAKVRTMTGLVVSNFAIDMPKEAVVGFSVNLLGQNTTVGNTSAVTGTPKEAINTEVMSAGVNVAEIKEDGVLAGIIDELSVSVNNNLRGLGAIGAIENICVASGRANVTGTINVYFQDWTTYQKFLDNDNSSLTWQLADSNGTYVFNIPRVKFTEYKVTAGGPDQDVMSNGSYQAIRDPDTDKTIIITKIVA